MAENKCPPSLRRLGGAGLGSAPLELQELCRAALGAHRSAHTSRWTGHEQLTLC